MTNHFNPRQYVTTQFGRPVAVVQDPKRDTPQARANAAMMAEAERLCPGFPAKGLAILEARKHGLIVGKLPKAPDEKDPSKAQRNGGNKKTDWHLRCMAEALAFVSAKPGRSIDDIAFGISRARSSAYRALAELVDAGEVAREKKARGRIVYNPKQAAQ